MSGPDDRTFTSSFEIDLLNAKSQPVADTNEFPESNHYLTLSSWATDYCDPSNNAGHWTGTTNVSRCLYFRSGTRSVWIQEAVGCEASGAVDCAGNGMTAMSTGHCFDIPQPYAIIVTCT
ncbi:Hypothetical predicted protein [Lecanosticta acicola]|uniref:Uncharacterized protein n=1 Tax=Lecanosticta acicola TaxID=111012 RepID=A0AAI8YVM0_9PEZI|nr:Hypothetical predicted protein [Lecanosticta acicola]